MDKLAFKAVAIAVFCMISFWPHASNAQTETDKFKEAVDLITKTAERLCGSLPQNGSQQSLAAQGNISTELLALLKSLGNIGISGTGTFSEESYQGVVREQLAGALKDERQCKENVFSILVQTFLVPRQTSLSSARLAFSRAEPFKAPLFSTDGKDLSFQTLKLWFKNVGQVAAQNETFADIILVKPIDKLLTNREEDDLFNMLNRNINLNTIHNDIQPGSDGYFYYGTGLSDEVWIDYKNNSGPPKFLYVMSMLTYQSDNLDNHDRITTETCVIYINKDNFSNWTSCQSDHNGIHRVQ